MTLLQRKRQIDHLSKIRWEESTSQYRYIWRDDTTSPYLPAKIHTTLDDEVYWGYILCPQWKCNRRTRDTIEMARYVHL